MMGDSHDYPAVLTAAGPAVCAAWKAFVADASYRPSTRKLYRVRALQFLRWLEPHGIGLPDATPGEVERYLEGLNLASDHSRMTYRTALRRFFVALVAHGVLASNPADRAARAEDDRPEKAQPDANVPPPTLAGLSDFLAVLGTTDEASRYYRPGLVAMYPIIVGGMDTSAIAAFTGIPLHEVELYVSRLRENGIWTADGKIVVDFDDPESAEAIVNLVLIISCAAGVFCRSPAPACEDSEEPPPLPGENLGGKRMTKRFERQP